MAKAWEDHRAGGRAEGRAEERMANICNMLIGAFAKEQIKLALKATDEEIVKAE